MDTNSVALRVAFDNLPSDEERGRMTSGDGRTDGKIDIGVENLEMIRSRKVFDLMGYEVWAVDGEYVRDHVDIDFTSGGNPGVYKYVPDGELWAEQTLSPDDFMATVFHECVECVLMMDMGVPYPEAHDFASNEEMALRTVNGITVGLLEEAMTLLFD